MRSGLAVAAGLSLAVSACAELPPPTSLPSPAKPDYDGYRSQTYSADRLWLCRPDLPQDRCRVDLTATESRPDGSRVPDPFVPARDPQVDCFYIYPTVDMGVVPRNHTDFSDVNPMGATAAAQIGRLGEACRVFAPLYRQITIGTYFVGSASSREERLAVAFSDVADAFAHYLGQYNGGRKVVIVGHSQGAEMAIRLLRKFFEGDSRGPSPLRERLLLALPIGGDVDVPVGARVGGTFATIPVCAGDDETGCVIAFRSYRAGGHVSPGRLAPPAGRETVCVNPTNVANELRPFSRTYLPTTGRARGFLAGIEGITTPFVVYRNMYAGKCEVAEDGFHYLSVRELRAAGDTRVSPFSLTHPLLNMSLGTHILDFQFPEGDLVDLIARRARGLQALPATPAVHEGDGAHL